MKNIKKTLKTILSVFTSNRFKSFYWRMGMMVLAGFIDLTLQSLTDLMLSPTTTVVLGLILGEISKYINSKK